MKCSFFIAHCKVGFEVRVKCPRGTEVRCVLDFCGRQLNIDTGWNRGSFEIKSAAPLENGWLMCFLGAECTAPECIAAFLMLFSLSAPLRSRPPTPAWSPRAAAGTQLWSRDQYFIGHHNSGTLIILLTVGGEGGVDVVAISPTPRECGEVSRLSVGPQMP